MQPDSAGPAPASWGSLARTKLMVSLGAKTNEINGEGLTPLQSAAWAGFDTLVQYLVDQGAELKLFGRHEP